MRSPFTLLTAMTGAGASWAFIRLGVSGPRVGGRGDCIAQPERRRAP